MEITGAVTAIKEGDNEPTTEGIYTVAVAGGGAHGNNRGTGRGPLSEEFFDRNRESFNSKQRTMAQAGRVKWRLL
jgi:hypothetical protein